MRALPSFGRTSDRKYLADCRGGVACEQRLEIPRTGTDASYWYMFSRELIAAMQSVVTGQAPITLERKITSGGKQKNERQLIDVTVVRRVRPRAERWCDCEGHRRWKRAGSTLFRN